MEGLEEKLEEMGIYNWNRRDMYDNPLLAHLFL